MNISRKFPIGSEIIKGRGVHFRVWAPDHKRVDLILENVEKKPLTYAMKPEKGGYFSLLVKEATEGTLYRYSLSNAKKGLPDPASKFQPEGSLGPSCVISSYYPWKDKGWRGVEVQGHVAYELHIGTFTLSGTFEAATKELERLAQLGITLIEIMPINGFPGRFGWGYDGVNLFSPFPLYGTPNDVKAFVDAAHHLGIGVILDVVYNHLGPEDNTIIQFAKDYLNKKHVTDWGQSINFDTPQSREFFLTNARYWIEEFHFDGLRVDATTCLFSSTPMHILEELTRVIKKAGGKRKTIAIAENESQDMRLIRSYEEGGYGFDMVWNDDFHHSAFVRLTGRKEAYYTDYSGSPQEFISSLKYGFLYQGQYYSWQKKNRGTSNLHAPAWAFMIFLENHDQVANSGLSIRLHQKSDPGNYRAMICLFLLSPNTPLIFQGQEFNSGQSFFYFSDHKPSIASLVRKGRKQELSQFSHLATKEARQLMPDPSHSLTFMQSKLKREDLKSGHKIYALFSDLIKLRKNDPVFKTMQINKIDGAVLGTDCFLIRYFNRDHGDRVLLINFGSDQVFTSCAEPLLSAGSDQNFEILLSTEFTKYGGGGTPSIETPVWKILGHSALVLKSARSGLL